MKIIRRLWILLAVVVLSSFVVLLWFGRDIYRHSPPIPEKVVVEGSGTTLFTAAQIRDGQNIWQSTGGQQLGSVMGHGSYVAPDWTADWLHREAVFMLERWARAEGASSYDSMDVARPAALKARPKKELRTNGYDPQTGTLTVSANRAEAIRANSAYYAGLFGGDTGGDFPGLREAYAKMEHTIKDPASTERIRQPIAESTTGHVHL